MSRTRMNREALLERKRELQALGRSLRPGSHQERQAHAEYDQVCTDLSADREQRIADLEAADSNPDALEEQVAPSLAAPVDRGPALAAALGANERETFLPEQAREHMERTLVLDDDPEQRLARFVVESSSREYFRAFAAWMRDPIAGGHEWTPAQREAVRRVKWLQRAMGLGTSGGGFLIPYALDPNIVIAGTGDVDPMRAICRVETSALNTKKYVTSLGVTSHWYAEAAEVTDDSPTLLQPSIDCRKAMAFVPVSFELFEDSDIATQIGRVFADSNVVEEGRVFTVGATASNEPNGIITALVAAGGGTIIATGTNVLPRATSTPTRRRSHPGGEPTPGG